MDYRIIRQNRKTMRLSVTAAGEVVVYASSRVTRATTDAFVAKHSAWVEKRRRELRSVPSFSDGETVEIGGAPVLITTGKTGLRGGILYLPAENRKEALVRFLKKFAKSRMEGILFEVEKRTGLGHSRLTVTSARRRWGSCGEKGNISFSFRTAFLPDDLAVYLAVHELCHTLELNHSRAFWQHVGAILPDYAARRAALKRYLWATECL